MSMKSHAKIKWGLIERKEKPLSSLTLSWFSVKASWHLQSCNLFLLIFQTQSKAEEKVFSFVSFGCCLLHPSRLLFPFRFFRLFDLVSSVSFCFRLSFLPWRTSAFYCRRECVRRENEWIFMKNRYWKFYGLGLNENFYVLGKFPPLSEGTPL